MKECYRIGWDSAEEKVILTFIAQNGHTMSLHTSPEECERMIRMIRAAYQEEVVYNRCVVCGDPKGHDGNKCNMFDSTL